MADSQEVYTYQAGQKIILKKQPDRSSSAALPDELEDLASRTRAVSSRSSRVTTLVPDLERRERGARTPPDSPRLLPGPTRAQSSHYGPLSSPSAAPSRRRGDAFAAAYGLQ